MSEENSLKIQKLSISEIAMVDLSYEILEKRKEPMQYRDLMREVASQKKMQQKTMHQYLPQLYTEINIDGRFVCVGRGLWGLRNWYPTEQASDSAVAANVKDDYLDDELEGSNFDEPNSFIEGNNLENLETPFSAINEDVVFDDDDEDDDDDDEKDNDLEDEEIDDDESENDIDK